MKPIFSTSTVHPRDRFDYWHSVACRQIAHHDSVAGDRAHFDASMAAGSVGNIDLLVFSNAAMTVRRDERSIARASEDQQLFFCRQLSGTLLLEQDGNKAILHEGTSALL